MIVLFYFVGPIEQMSEVLTKTVKEAKDDVSNVSRFYSHSKQWPWFFTIPEPSGIWTNSTENVATKGLEGFKPDWQLTPP
jgi:hypothetical protein